MDYSANNSFGLPDYLEDLCGCEDYGESIVEIDDASLPEGAPLTEEENALFGSFLNHDQDAASLPKVQNFGEKGASK